MELFIQIAIQVGVAAGWFYSGYLCGRSKVAKNAIEDLKKFEGILDNLKNSYRSDLKSFEEEKGILYARLASYESAYNELKEASETTS